MRETLTTLARQADAAGVELVFLTYPADRPLSPMYSSVNGVIRTVAAATGKRLIDLGSRIGATCTADAACDTLLRDHHPSVPGHRQAATLILDTLARPETKPPSG